MQEEQRHTPPPVTPVAPAAPSVPAVQKPRHDNVRNILSTLAVLLIAPLVAIFLTMFVFQSYQVDGQSMETTLHNNDRLLVWKTARTWARITGHPYVPKRGDIVVFTDSRLSDFGQDPGKQLIKRVVGLPGDRVVVSNNVVTIYNTQHPNGFQPDNTLPYKGTIKATNIDGEWTVGKDQVFLMGDNRLNSLDSRLFGPVDANNIIGKLVIRVLPANTMERF